MRADARSTPARSEAVPASTPGLSVRNTSGRWKLSHTEMKWAALVAAAVSMDPANAAGWLATTPTASEPMRARAQMIEPPKPGWISRYSAASTTSPTTAYMS